MQQEVRMRVKRTIGAAVWTLCSTLSGVASAGVREAPGPAVPKQASLIAGKSMNDKENVHLTADTRIGDVLRHPAFAGFGRLLLPWDNRPVNDDLRLKDIGKLLPYHSHVEPGTVVAALNHMIDDAGAGKSIFYEFYSEAQRQANPELARTGLFFFRGKPGAPFAVIAPGGGFQYVASVHEGFPYAAEIARSGYNAFVLKYRVGSGGAATADLAAALAYIFKHAAALGVDTHSYSLWGSSAGARMAAAIGTHGTAPFGGPALPKPAAVVMAYTGHTEVGRAEPRTFVVVGEHDGIAPPAAMWRRVDALRKAGTEVEYHVYPGLGHGFGLGTGTRAEGWAAEAIRF
jgi:acetyl esterase/lipase